LLGEELARIGVPSRPVFVVGPLVPSILIDDPDIAAGADLVEVHELLTVSVPGRGPCRVDITWDPPLIHAGLAGSLEWDGSSDMVMAIGEPIAFYAPDPDRLREEKEALRRRLYSEPDRDRRDRALAAMSARFELLRQGQVREGAPRNPGRGLS
jgi:hypothetical protein